MVGWEHAVANAFAWKEHGDLRLVHGQRGGELRTDETSANNSKTFAVVGQVPQATVISQSPKVDDVFTTEWEPARHPACRQQQLFKRIDLLAVIRNGLLLHIDVLGCAHQAN